jgi:hypothetical protein
MASQKYYYFIGDTPAIPQGITRIERPSTTFYSPRVFCVDKSKQRDVSSLSTGGRTPTKVFYATDRTFSDIYEFIFTCRASKLTENYFFIGTPGSIEYLEDNAIMLGSDKLYNIVSGDKIPTTISPRGLSIITQYLCIELHYFHEYVRSGLNKTKILQSNHTSQPRIISAGGHLFTEDQGWVVNVSNIPIGTLIDYYRIESGINGVDGQLAFTRDPEYRYTVYKRLKEVLVTFIRHNTTDSIDKELSENTKDETVIEKMVSLIHAIQPH